ncbi:phytanoyl-CoA dioxygenase family protein [Nonomuraea sp. SYSU D8015]|uniref:phytanoyl-CoA dioxygenase family protein n=1 Tax=Nonomuraea sp. SYSU D8015 TaxID=2593644 RepID=UPI00166164F6|nr:phytanoyl-CoA dioxygenase family protein [Nonomuraea sp. SYSU D8015]
MMSLQNDGVTVVAEDSTPIAGDPDALRRRLREDGMLLFRGLLPQSRLTELRARFTEVLRRHDWLDGDASDAEPRPAANRRDGSPRWWRMYEDLQRVELMHELSHAPQLVQVMKAILGKHLLNHTRRQVSLVHPGFWIPPHQEHTYVQGTPDVLTAWAPFTAFPADGGTLRVLRERSVPGVRPLTVLDTGGVQAVVEPGDGEWWRAPDLGPGDVVVVHALATREVEENLSPYLRGAVEYRYQSAREPVCFASLRPHHYPRVPGWDELAAGWAQRRWLRVPLRVRQVDFLLPERQESWHELLPRPASRLLDVEPGRT